MQEIVLCTLDNLAMKHMSKSNNIKLKFQNHVAANRAISTVETTNGNQLTVPGRRGLPRQHSHGDRRSSQPGGESSPKPYKSITIPAIKTKDQIEGGVLHHLIVWKRLVTSLPPPLFHWLLALGEPPAADPVARFAGGGSPAGAGSSYFGAPVAANMRPELREERGIERRRRGEAECVGGDGHCGEESRSLGFLESRCHTVIG
jgi:hypothetical protein